jgi:hypothetical protein
VPVGQVHEPQVAGAPVDQGADRRATGSPHDQVALPVTDPGALLDHARAGVDQPARRDEPWRARHRRAPALAQRSPGAQLLGQRPARAAFPAVTEGLVDRLVTEMPGRPVRVGLPQVRRNLRRTPLLGELVLHDLAQLRLAGRHRPARPAQSFPGARVRQVAVVEAAVVRPQMAAQLPADR